MKRLIIASLIALMVLAGCSESLGQISKKSFAGPMPTVYVDKIVEETIVKFTELDMSEYEKVKAAFDYIIETGCYNRPLALDVWRIRCGEGELPTYLENRTIGILSNGLDTCEDYSAALVLLLECMGV